MLRSLQHLRRDQVFGMTRMIFEMKGNSVNIPHTVFFTGLNLIANMIFSRSMLDPNHKESMDFMEAFTTALMLGGKPNLDDSFPFLAFMDPQGRGKRDKKDFLGVLLELKEDELSLTDIKVLIYELLVAGSDTTSTAIEWIMTELIRHPNVLKRAREELEEKVGCTRKVEEHDIDELPYLYAVIKGGFRLHPPLPFLIPHRAEKSCANWIYDT
ncbi:hypothetical protein SUGI_0657140 [Cryptomeria japonica]|nr:hypothetical protein SUGI_0657140 [Cryptomeria japonica]